MSVIGINNGDLASTISAPKAGALDRLTQLFWSIMEWLGIYSSKVQDAPPKVDFVEEKQVVEAPSIPTSPIPPPSAPIVIPKSKASEIVVIERKPVVHYPADERINGDDLMRRRAAMVRHPRYCQFKHHDRAVMPENPDFLDELHYWLNPHAPKYQKIAPPPPVTPFYVREFVWPPID